MSDPRARIVAMVDSLPQEDQEVLARILEELPRSKLLASCNAYTDDSRQAPGTKRRLDPTPLLVRARAELLGCYRTFKQLATPPALLSRRDFPGGEP